MAVVANSHPKFSVVIQSDAVKKLINNTLSDSNRAARFVTGITSAVATNHQLQTCSPMSVISGALLGEALNLSPSPQLGEYYLVPYNNKNTGETEATFQLGYKGYLHLAIRSGQYKDIDVMDIREGEFLGRDSETGKFKFKFITDEATRLSKPVIGYMAYFEMLNGFRKTLYMSKEEMEIHANTYSKAFDLATYKKIEAGQIPQKDMWKYSSFWYKNFDAMAYKTILRQLLSKWGIMSVEMQDAFVKDQAVQHENGDYEYVDIDDSTQEASYTEKETNSEVEPETPEKEKPKKVKKTSKNIEPTQEEVKFSEI